MSFRDPMRKDDLSTVAVTIAVLSLIANFVQYSSARPNEHEVARAYVTDRMKAMESRANAFYALVLGNEKPLALRYNLKDGEDELIVEFGVRIPCAQQEPFLRWMKGWDVELNGERAVHVTGYRGGGSGYRTFKESGKEVGELYERMTFRF